MPEIVRAITLPGGESLPMLVQSGHAPVLEPLRYSISILRNAGRAESTIDAHVRAIAMARSWAHANGISLEARMIAGAGLDLREVESLTHALKSPRSSPAHPQARPARGNVLPFARRLPPVAVSASATQTGANRVRFVAGYLEWLAGQGGGGDARRRSGDTVEALLARSRVRGHWATRPVKGLTSEQRERLFSVIDPSSPQNPFRSPAAGCRNLAMVACLDETGMRRGELAGLRIVDADFRALTVSVHRRPPDPGDPRRGKPRTKTNARAIPIRPELADILFEYISTWRRAEPGALEHDYVFVSHGGTRPGAPLSPRSIGKVFDVLQGALGFGLHPHILRHTWNDRFSAALDRQSRHGTGMPEAGEERIRNYLMGWSPDSRSADGYSRRHVERAAREALGNMHEGLYEDE
ncbi:MAG: site-specific integrase [Gemmatimonadota bacterium]|nr:site-specific integrase [Gemmatimonadota bacterium]